MSKHLYEPFDADVNSFGGYQYTSNNRRSSIYANRRLSDETINNIEFHGKRIVDIGCGDGTYTAVLHTETQAKFILGIDPSKEAVNRANNKYKNPKLEFRVCFANELVEAGESFDIAILRGVIHHVNDPAQEIGTTLKLAKTVFFIEPNGWNPVVKLLENVSPYHREHHERSFLLHQYRRWIEHNGGKIERTFYFGLVPFFCPDWLVSIGSFLEPYVERIALIRTLCCGQIGIVATRAW